MENAASHFTTTSGENELAAQYLLSVDGAGVFLLCLENEVTIGGLRTDENRADVCLMADLSRKHLTIARSQNGYLLKPHDSVTLKNQEFPVEAGESVNLESTAEWTMGENVEIQFRRPTVLSLTAVLDFPSSHRPLVGQPSITVDRVILMDQNCLIGPGSDQHIPLRDCPDSVILYRDKGRLYCKAKTEFTANDQSATCSYALDSGDVIAGEDFRFRIEAVAN